MRYGCPEKIPPLAVIGASAGGPNAVARILREMPDTFQGTMIVIQHVEREFSMGLADFLGTRCRLKVMLAPEGGHPEPGRVYVAGGDQHLVLNRSCRFSYTPDPVELPYHPSVDVFFNSLRNIQAIGSGVRPADVAVLLSGMGRDGASGLLTLRRAGWHTIAQDEASSAVYGMPKAAVELGAAVEILSPPRIARCILARLRNHRKEPALA